MEKEEFYNTFGKPNKDVDLFKKRKPRKYNKLNKEEDEHAYIFAEYCRKIGIKSYHIANETGTSNIGYIMKRRKMGVNKGIADYYVIIPISQNENIGIWIELKTEAKTSKQSPEQKEFEIEINKIKGSQYFLCRTGFEACELVERMISNIRDITKYAK